MPKMLQYLKDVGVKVRTNEEVMNLSLKNGQIHEIITDKGTVSADEFILSAGSWTGILSKKLNIKLPLQPGKGYRINVKRPLGITMPAVLMESSMAVTPMNGFTRFAGTMEFSGINDKIRKERVQAIAAGAKKYYPEIEITAEEKSQAKSGMRPVTPDGLPYICLLYTSPSPRDQRGSRMPSSA